MTDQDDARRRGVAVGKIAAVNRLDAERRQEIAAHPDGADALGIAAAGQVDALGAQGGQLLERGRAGDEVGDVAGRRREAVEAGPALHLVAELPRHDQPIGVRERKRPHQRRVDDAENRGVGANAEGERHERNEGEPGPERQGPQGNPDVVHLCWTRTRETAPGIGRVRLCHPERRVSRAIDEWDEYIAHRCERSTFGMMDGAETRACAATAHPPSLRENRS